MATYYSQYQIPQASNFPILTDWSNIVSTVQVPNLYNSPVQTLPMQLLTPVIAPICPYTGIMLNTEPISATLAPNTVITEEIVSICDQVFTNTITPEIITTEEHIVTEVFNYENPYIKTALAEQTEERTEELNEIDPIELYLTLPKELFPSARMFPIDPNRMIDEFCKIANINENASWILDMEFGVPRVPVTRTIAVYDVKLNSIHCKNTPSAIHPGFEKCNEDFKKVVLFYYDCIVSTWYKGYIVMNYDKNVDNFQSWLLIPMQIFGMCWS